MHASWPFKNVLQPRSTRLSRRVRKTDRRMLIQQPVIRNLTGIGGLLRIGARRSAGRLHLCQNNACCRDAREGPKRACAARRELWEAYAESGRISE